MNRSKALAIACSAALLGAGAAFAQQAQGQERMQQQGAQATQQGAQRGSPHNQVAQEAGQPTNVIVTGEILDARDVTLAATAGDKHRLFRVKTNAGKEVVIDVGAPQGEMKQAEFTKGDRIVAMGKPARINGRPVLFAASVAEMQKLERELPASATGQDQQRRSAMTQGAQQGQQQEAQQGRQQQTAGTQDPYDTVIVFFETENLAEDEYGYYDEDFAWTTEDRYYDTWDDTSAWDDTERAHFDMFGYDDAGEEGIWDW